MESQSARSPVASHHSLLIAGTVTVVGFLATTLAQPRVLVHIPLQNLLKNVLHTDRSFLPQSAAAHCGVFGTPSLAPSRYDL